MLQLEQDITEALERADKEIQASRVEQLEIDLAAAREQNLRLQADFENWRKRVARESQELDRRIRADLITRLLPVLDNLERALRAADDRADDSLVQGVRMVYDQLTSLLSEMGLTALECVGQVFDPALHEAVGTQICADLPEGCIVEEHERGYRFGGEILRPAKVVISVPLRGNDQ